MTELSAASTPMEGIAAVLACPQCDGQMVLTGRGPEPPAYYCDCGWWEDGGD